MHPGKSEVAIAVHQLGSVEFLRSGAYCNLTDMAKTFDKRVDNWMRLKSTQELIAAFEVDPSYEGMQPFFNQSLRSEGTGQFVAGGGLMAHPDIAIVFAQWCSPAFHLWVSRQIRHLLQYGEVNLHYREWTQEEYQRGLEYNREDLAGLHP